MEDLDYRVNAVNEFYKKAEAIGYFEDRRLHHIVKENLAKIAGSKLPNESIDTLIQMVEALCINHKELDIERIVLDAKQEDLVRRIPKDIDAFMKEFKESIDRKKYPQEKPRIYMIEEVKVEPSRDTGKQHLDDVHKSYLQRAANYITGIVKRNASKSKHENIGLHLNE